MKTCVCILLVLLSLLLPGCGASEGPVPTVEATVPTEAAETTPETREETLPPETTQAPTVPEHSALYIPGISGEDVVRYFGEVCLDAEMINSGDPNLLQKWTVPIRYVVYGSCTEEDMAVLSGFAQWMNTIEGFPGIGEAGEGETVNLRIHFCEQPEMTALMGEDFYGLDGAVTFWYDYDAIYDATICCRSDLSQYTRNSVLLEELYNGLGPIQDTDLRTDSIIYAGFSEPQVLTEMDELILKLLYHPDMVCGMNAEECAAVIRQLYY